MSFAPDLPGLPTRREVSFVGEVTPGGVQMVRVSVERDGATDSCLLMPTIRINDELWPSPRPFGSISFDMLGKIRSAIEQAVLGAISSPSYVITFIDPTIEVEARRVAREISDSIRGEGMRIVKYGPGTIVSPVTGSPLWDPTEVAQAQARRDAKRKAAVELSGHRARRKLDRK